MPETCLFAFPSQRRLARGFRGLPGLTPGGFSLERFANGECRVELRAAVAGKRCLVLGTITPPERNLVSYLLLCHTLAGNGAASVTALLPYLAYSRHDRKEPRRSFGAAWIGGLLAAAGVGAVVTVDVHSPRLDRLFPMPVTSLSPAGIFAREIRERGLLDATLVAPDEGAIRRCRAVAREAHMEREVAWMTKTRTPRGIVHGRLHGRVGRRAVIVDDMLDTGGTLLSCCAWLHRHGVRDLYVMVTHGLFTGNEWRKLWRAGVRLVACTDTVPVRSPAARRITVLSAAPLLIRGAGVTGSHEARPRPRRAAVGGARHPLGSPGTRAAHPLTSPSTTGA